MRRGRPIPPIVLTQCQEEQLTLIASSRSLSHGVVVRARIVLTARDGATDIDIAPEVGLCNWMVGYWRRGFLAQGVEGLYDEMKPGRPGTIEDDRIDRFVKSYNAKAAPFSWTASADPRIP